MTRTVVPRWLSLAEASKYVSMHRQTLMRYIVAGKIYGALKGGKWFVDRESIDAFMLEDNIEIARFKTSFMGGQNQV
jgi:excisionase family DNA binding protein